MYVCATLQFTYPLLDFGIFEVSRLWLQSCNPEAHPDSSIIEQPPPPLRWLHWARSTEDRTQTLLSLLSRFHVLGDETAAGGCLRDEEAQPPAVTAAVKDDGEGGVQSEKEEEGSVTGNQTVQAKYPDKGETPATGAREDQTEQGGQKRGVMDGSDDETTVAEPQEGQDGQPRNETQEETERHQESRRKSEGVAEQAEGTVAAVQEIGAVKLEEVGNAGETAPPGEIGVGIDQGANDSLEENTAKASHIESDQRENKATLFTMVDGTDGGEDARQLGMRMRFSIRTREECEGAFVELMLDERNR